MTTNESESRPSISPNQHIDLVSQVDRHCPLCSRPLIELVGRKRHKRYDVAHIYPLNPTPAEVALLCNEERLSHDPNDLDNLIPLCGWCHPKFDKPRTVAGYRELCRIKRNLINRDGERDLWHQYPLETELAAIVHSLAEQTKLPELPTDYNVTSLAAKTANIPNLTKRKIRDEVRYYYLYLRQVFLQLELSNPSTSRLIASQVQAYYLAQSKLITEKRELYLRVVRWIERRTNGTSEAAGILASFFVQNCEVLS